MKKCNQCNELKSLDNYYKQIRGNSHYVYYNPKCKKCCSENAQKWNDLNISSHRKNLKKYQKTSIKYKIGRRKYSEMVRRNGEYREWQRENRDKLREYRIKRAERNHNISQKEWETCKNYFDYSCAYCGISEDDHKKIYNQQLHKEHVEHDGANDLSNCVPSCKICNSEKGTKTLSDWYNKNNAKFCNERINKINKWLMSDYK